MVLGHDKSTWGDGPWQDEPDEWSGDYHGFRCHALRMLPQGHWCGYLALSANHPWHGKKGDEDTAEFGRQVHGGITYAKKHRLKPDLWVIGFDCAHAYDLCPGTSSLLKQLGHSDTAMPNRGHDFLLFDEDVYRTLHFVQMQLMQLASQAANAAAQTPSGL